MSRELIPRNFLENIWDFDDDLLSLFDTRSTSGLSSGLSVSEDDKHVFVEASVPGVDPDKIEVSYDKGVLWIRGQQEQEKNQDRKYYRKASSSFSYRMAIPGNVDQDKDPEATYKNGIMKVTFSKVPEPQPKKIAVKVQ
ncbi:Hsp20/alpha crystallin family protein [Candidatus Parcubacteria bacterium]|nr:MAG: Hsp20/alpha crystallin family protein [Candidatus Parcubacteria bacterium]